MQLKGVSMFLLRMIGNYLIDKWVDCKTQRLTSPKKDEMQCFPKGRKQSLGVEPKRSPDELEETRGPGGFYRIN